MDDKLRSLRKRLLDLPADAFMISNATNWRYVSGFTGDAGTCVITDDRAIVFTDSRYVEQAQMEAPGFEVCVTVREKDVLRDRLMELGVKRLAFEKDHVTYSSWEKLKEKFEGVELVGVSGWVEELRAIKTSEEVKLISRAQEIADSALAMLLNSLKRGVCERDVALDLEFTMRKMGAQGPAFPIIVVSGERSSLPHGTPSERVFRDGDFVTIDWGAQVGGYCSDCTRTFIIGVADSRHEEIYRVVKAAQEEALAAVKPGGLAKDVDLAGRKVIEDAGYGEYFGHSIGHGVGLAVHERPVVGPKSDAVLEPGMVITVEPGIYVPGFGGVRIEDLVLVTDTGCKILSTNPKDLMVL